jgi:DNA-binding protein YbaB
MAFDQVKMLNKLRKAQSDLKKEIVEVEAGDGAVVVQVTGELKITWKISASLNTGLKLPFATDLQRHKKLPLKK